MDSIIGDGPVSGTYGCGACTSGKKFGGGRAKAAAAKKFAEEFTSEHAVLNEELAKSHIPNPIVLGLKSEGKRKRKRRTLKRRH